MDNIARKKKILLYPGRVVFTYLICTVFLYFFGPYKWKIENPIIVFVYLLFSYIMVIYGYNNYAKKCAFKYSFKNEDRNDLYLSTRTIRFVMIFSIVSHILYSYYVYGGINFQRVLNLAQSYLENKEFESSHNIITRLLTYFWGINYFYLPIGIIYFRKIRTLDKVLFFAAIMSDVLFWLSIGTMKGLGDIICMAALPIYLSTTKNVRHNENIIAESKKRKRLIILIGIIFFSVFTYSQVMRMTLRGKSLYAISPLIAQHVKSVNNEWVLAGLNSIIFYITHGYQGLSYSLQLPFKWTYFVGNSRAFTKIIETHFIGRGAISSLIYPARIETEFGWANGSIWPSCFSWLASDITFFGIPILLFIMARIFAKCIYSFMENDKISALVLSSYLCIFFVYLPCNNQIVQSERSFYSLILILIVYYIEKNNIRFVAFKR